MEQGALGMQGRNLDSRATSGASSASSQQQQQSQQASSAAVRNRPFEIVEAPADRHDDAPDDYYISDLCIQLNQVISAKPTEIDPLRIGECLDDEIYHHHHHLWM